MKNLFSNLGYIITSFSIVGNKDIFRNGIPNTSVKSPTLGALFICDCAFFLMIGGSCRFKYPNYNKRCSLPSELGITDVISQPFGYSIFRFIPPRIILVSPKVPSVSKRNNNITFNRAVAVTAISQHAFFAGEATPFTSRSVFKNDSSHFYLGQAPS